MLTFLLVSNSYSGDWLDALQGVVKAGAGVAKVAQKKAKEGCTVSPLGGGAAAINDEFKKNKELSDENLGHIENCAGQTETKTVKTKNEKGEEEEEEKEVAKHPKFLNTTWSNLGCGTKTGPNDENAKEACKKIATALEKKLTWEEASNKKKSKKNKTKANKKNQEEDNEDESINEEEEEQAKQKSKTKKPNKKVNKKNQEEDNEDENVNEEEEEKAKSKSKIKKSNKKQKDKKSKRKSEKQAEDTEESSDETIEE